jgi:hypothetical protein
MSDATTQPLKPFKAHLNLSFQGLDAACAGKQIRDGLEALEELGFVVETMVFGEPSLFDARDGASEGHSPGPAADAPSGASRPSKCPICRRLEEEDRGVGIFPQPSKESVPA